MFKNIDADIFTSPLRAITTLVALTQAQKKVNGMVNEHCDPQGCYGAEADIEEFGEPVGIVYYDRRGSSEVEFGIEFYDDDTNISWIKGRYDHDPVRLDA